MKVLVTGGGGFVGGAVSRLLAQSGHEVRSYSRGAHPELAAEGIDVFSADIGDFDAIRAACRGFDAVIHCAAKVGLWGPYADFYQVNVTGTANVIKACQEVGVPRLVFTSSPSVVLAGRDAEGIDESAPYARTFESHYCHTKAIAEEMVLASNTASLGTLALRPHLVWGPGEDQLVSRILAKASSGELRRIGAFNKLVDTTFIDDAAEAHRLAVERLAPGAAVAGKAYFISGGDPRPVWDIVNAILAAAGRPPVTRVVKPAVAWAAAWALEAFHSLAKRDEEPEITRFLVRQLTTAHWFNISAARQDLGYEPRCPVDAGLARLQTWFEAQGRFAPGETETAPPAGETR
jgi:nucleoside-diphosphate-sugar epimerase